MEKPMPTALDLTPDDIQAYRAAARRLQKEEQQALLRREERAWELARQAERLLREKFGATHVVVFGSLVHAEHDVLWIRFLIMPQLVLSAKEVKGCHYSMVRDVLFYVQIPKDAPLRVGQKPDQVTAKSRAEDGGGRQVEVAISI
jgi:hypothetical protein